MLRTPQLKGSHVAGRLPRQLALSVRAVLALSALASCAAPAPVSRIDSGTLLPTVDVVLPGGGRIVAELALTTEEQARGLMFRSDLAPSRGMLFVGDRASLRPFWMYQCLIPLDMIWLDGSRRIVEIVPNAPPCRESDPRQCPSYGGTVNSVYVLELAAGRADALGLGLGERLEFRE